LILFLFPSDTFWGSNLNHIVARDVRRDNTAAMFALHVLAVFAALSGRVTAQDATAKTSVGQPFFITASPTASAKVSATASSTSGPATIQVAVGGVSGYIQFDLQ
jgi:hypothetical protein